MKNPNKNDRRLKYGYDIEINMIYLKYSENSQSEEEKKRKKSTIKIQQFHIQFNNIIKCDEITIDNFK